MSGHHEDSASLPSSGGLLHGHHGSASVPPLSQHEGFTGATFFSWCLPVLYSMSSNTTPLFDCVLFLSLFYKNIVPQ